MTTALVLLGVLGVATALVGLVCLELWRRDRRRARNASGS